MPAALQHLILVEVNWIHMQRIRLLIADDHTLFRQSIAEVLRSQTDMEIVGQARDASEAIEFAETARPDVILMDINMPGMPAFDAARQIRSSTPGAKLLFLTMHDDEDYLVESLGLGAHGYILKDTETKVLIAAIRDVHFGGKFLSPRMLTRLMEDVRVNPATGVKKGRHDALSGRERQVLKILAEGKTVKEIATDFNLSVKTVEAHKFNLMRKLGIHNKAKLVQYAVAKNILKVH